MAYVTGIANNVGDIRTAIFNACTANGWTLSGEILHKGTAYFRLQLVNSDIQLMGGTGKVGGNNLTGQPLSFVTLNGTNGALAMTFPATYHIHIGATPDEVYVVVNYATDFYQWLAFGQSHISMTGATGNWFAASYGNVVTAGLLQISATGNGVSGSNAGALFWNNGTGASMYSVNAYLHHGLSGGSGWSANGNAVDEGGIPNATQSLIPLIAISPNAFNGESFLLPIPVVVRRPSSLYSVVAQPKYARYIRIDNHNPGQILTIGGEQWKIYPWLKKDAVNRNGGTNVSHSGTFGWAIRYTP